MNEYFLNSRMRQFIFCETDFVMMRFENSIFEK